MLIYLCDDCESDILRLKHYLNIYARQRKLCFELVSFSSGEELLTYFKHASPKPALIFLDIYMTKLNGIETARRLRSLHYQGGLIFATASARHAMDSYEVNALYYLQKPYNRRHFENAMARCGPLFEGIQSLYTFSRRGKSVSIPYENIVFFETGRSHNVILHTASGSYSFSGTLTQITDFFKQTGYFLRVGRSFLINLKHVSDWTDHDLSMSDGSIVPLPIRKHRDIVTAVENWQKGPPNL